MNKKKFIGLLVFIVFSCSKTGDNSPPEQPNFSRPNEHGDAGYYSNEKYQTRVLQCA